MLPDSVSHILILNAAEGLLQFLLARREGAGDGTFLVRECFQSWHAPSQGAELLAPALQDALKRLKLAPGQVGGIASVCGPGSFTGLRLALATAAGLARATGALQAGLAYMPLLAENAADSLGETLPEGSRVWVLTHARRQLVHMQGFAVNDALSPLGDIAVCSPVEAVGMIAAGQTESGVGGSSARPVLLGSGLGRNREGIEAALVAAGIADAILLPSRYEHPGEDALLRAAERAVFTERDVEALYVRPSDAEENLEGIARSLGLNPVIAKERLARLTGKKQ